MNSLLNQPWNEDGYVPESDDEAGGQSLDYHSLRDVLGVTATSKSFWYVYKRRPCCCIKYVMQTHLSANRVGITALLPCHSEMRLYMIRELMLNDPGGGKSRNSEKRRN